MPDNLLEATGLTRTFHTARRSVEVLRDCSLTLAPGESVAILGASGSGKSTLIQILGSLDRPDEGRLLYDGQDVLSLKRSALARFRREELGFVFQFHHLLPDFSALDNTAMPRFITEGVGDEVRARAAGLLRRVGLSDRLDHRPAELSGGEQQRVAIARALMNSPRLLLADEPTGNLDEAMADEVAEILYRVRGEEGLSLLMVTHDLRLADRADRTIRLEGGRILS